MSGGKAKTERNGMAGPDIKSGLTDREKREIWQLMRVPVTTFVALMVFLSINIAIGWLQPFPHAWIAELPIMVCMIVMVLLYSMEVIKDPPLVRFFSVLGFCWVAIMFTMTMTDYLAR